MTTLSRSFGALLFLIWGLCSPVRADATRSMRVEYQSPVAGALYVTPETNIILRLSEPVDASNIHSSPLIMVTGSKSGTHLGSMNLADDGQTILFKPDRPFDDGETVTAVITRAIRSGAGAASDAYSFSFDIRPSGLPQSGTRSLDNEMPREAEPPERPSPDQFLKTAGDTLPLDFPYVNAQTSGTVAPGRLFLSNFQFFGTYVPYLLILDNSGTPVFYRKMASRCVDFKLQPNGLLTYYQDIGTKFYAMDSSYAVVDSFMTGNGYTTDLHELRLLPNGHALLMSYDIQTVDMSQIAAGGNPAAQVYGLIVQEIDQNKQVVFQWRSWDHFQISDATHEDLTASSIDYVHGNAIEEDLDGNLLLSSRHMDEITKINRSTGDIMWRWGGKHNEFTFIGDSLGFFHQHAVRRLPNGNITLFDNGNYHSTPFSRAVEYELDEQHKTATLVWQYRNSPDIYGSAMGYVQRLPNGNTLIGWGSTNPSVTEVGPDGSKVYELTLAPTVFSYRAYRFPWNEGNSGGPSSTPTAYVLSQNYPNPFNSTTKIQVGLPEDAMVSFKIYDVLGRVISTQLEGEPKSKGNYELIFNGSSLPSGVYLYRLRTQSMSQTRKMQLIR